jgi:uncharacterized protein (TIGR02145 family)
MRNLKYIIFSVILFVTMDMQGQTRKAFYTSDNVVYVGDTVILEVPSYYGNIQWQKSSDMANWTNIQDATNGNFELIADSSAYYRAEIIGGICSAVYSDTILINALAKNIKIFAGNENDNRFKIDSATSPEITIYDLTVLDSLNVGDIMVSTNGDGFLRKIESIDIQGDSGILVTSEVSLEEIIDLGQLSYEQNLLSDSIESIELAEGVQLITSPKKGAALGIELSFSQILFDDDKKDETTGDQVRIEGSFAMNGTLRLDWEIDSVLKYLLFEFGVEQSTDLNLSVGLLGLSYEPEPKKIGTINFKRMTIFIGGFPVIIRPVLDLYLGFEAGANFSVETGISQTSFVKTGVVYENKEFVSYKESDFNIEPIAPQFTGEANVRAYIQPEIKAKIYGTIAPKVIAETYLALQLTPFEEPWWNLVAGVSAGIGIEMKVLSKKIFDYSEEGLINFEWELLHAQTRPDAVITVTPESGEVSTEFTFDASQSTDANDNAALLNVRWDWEGDGVWDTPYTLQKTAKHTYSQDGSYQPILEVKNTSDGKDTAKLVIVVTTNGNQTGTLTDKDGNTYKTVTIGTQTWMAENLKTTQYNDGTPIPLVTDANAWYNLSTPGYCWYNNEEATYKATYGALYNWYTVNTGKLCPTGWHVPTDAEWTVLTDFLGGEAVAGGKLKEAGFTHWYDPNTSATNETGFTALPGGYRGGGGYFYGIGYYGGWWSSTEGDADGAWGRYVYYSNSDVYRNYNDKLVGFSVRCVRDY